MTLDAVEIRARYLNGARLKDEEAVVLAHHVEQEGRAAWERHRAGESLEGEDEAWFQAIVRFYSLSAKRKQKQKQEPTDEERAFLREAERQRRQGKTKIIYYPTPELMEQHAAAAEAAGMNFNEWVLHSLDEALHGTFVDPEFVQMLKDRVVELEVREQNAVERSEEHRRRAEEAEEKLKLLHDRLLQFTERLMAGGPDAAKKWLEETA